MVEAEKPGHMANQEMGYRVFVVLGVVPATSDTNSPSGRKWPDKSQNGKFGDTSTHRVAVNNMT